MILRLIVACIVAVSVATGLAVDWLQCRYRPAFRNRPDDDARPE